MTRNEFIKKLCETLAEFKDINDFQLFPCICGNNKLNEFGNPDVPEWVAEVVIQAVKDANPRN